MDRVTRKNANRYRAFSFVELLVVVGMLTILVAILLPYFAAARETERRARCVQNLNAIMAAMTHYASANRGLYPAVAYDPAHNPNGYTAYTGADSIDPFAKNTKVSPNDVTAGLWLLVRQHMVQGPAVFICPSTGDSRDPCRTNGKEVDPDHRSNFTDGSHLSYSYSSPYSSAPGYQMDDTRPADFALMADKNPGVSTDKDPPYPTYPAYNADPFTLSQANSLNHGRGGQNVLYADGHVSFQPTPYCGVGIADQRDNIYTALSPIPLVPGERPPVYSVGICSRNVGPSWKDDSYLVPVEGD